MLADFLEGVTVWAPIVMKQGPNTPGPTPSPPTAPSYRFYVDGDLVDTAPAPQATENNLTIGAADVFSDWFEVASTSCRSVTGRWTRGKWAATNHAVRTMKSRSHQPDLRKTLTAFGIDAAHLAIDSLGQQMGQHAPQISADLDLAKTA